MVNEKLESKRETNFHLHITNAEYPVLKTLHQYVLGFWKHHQEKDGNRATAKNDAAVYELGNLGFAFEHYDKHRDQEILFTPVMVHRLVEGCYMFGKEVSGAVYEFMNSPEAVRLQKKLGNEMAKAAVQL